MKEEFQTDAQIRNLQNIKALRMRKAFYLMNLD